MDVTSLSFENIQRIVGQLKRNDLAYWMERYKRNIQKKCFSNKVKEINKINGKINVLRQSKRD